MTWGAIGGAAIGLVGTMMSDGPSGGGQQASTTTQTANPWAGVQPALLDFYQGARDNFHSAGPQYYPNSTIAPQGGVTRLGQQSLFGRATEGNPLLGTAQQEASDTLNGAYFGANPTMGTLMDIGNGSMLGQNPYMDGLFNQAATQVGNQYSKKILPGIASMFSGAGRFGSNQMAEGLKDAEGQYGNTMTDLATKMYGGNYANERALQQQALGEAGTQFGRERALQSNALGMAGGLAAADYGDINALLGLGTSQDAYAQNQLNADINRWDFNVQRPNAQLEFMSRMLQGGLNTGSTSSTSGSQSQTQPTNPLMGALGGALTGNRVMGLFGGGSSTPASLNSGIYGLMGDFTGPTNQAMLNDLY